MKPTVPQETCTRIDRQDSNNVQRSQAEAPSTDLRRVTNGRVVHSVDVGDGFGDLTSTAR